jgi:UDP-N-acetylmuramate dehydrogenase
MNFAEHVHMASLARASQQGLIRFNEPMAKHTTWKTGGQAQRAFTPRGRQDLVSFLRALDASEPLWFMGLGSNVLVRDGGLKGTVIFLHAAFKHMHLSEVSACVDKAGAGSGQVVPTACLYVEAGAPSPKVARFAAAHHLGGAEFLAGIPGTMGGALAMNAGCFGAQTWDIVARVETIDRQGVIRMRSRDDFKVGYRRVLLKKMRTRKEACEMGKSERAAQQEWFMGAWLRLGARAKNAAEENIKTLMAKRVATQPLDLPNAGSVFRNPDGDYAARLVEFCGLKGLRIGGAMVSMKHANFIVNVDRASATDIETLIEKVRTAVRLRTGVDLVQEVRIIGQTK